MPLRDALADAGLKAMNLTHRAILGVSGRRLLTRPGGMPVVELHTTGRRTGLTRSTLLTAPVFDADRVVLVASKGGDHRNPEWYLNLVANPDVEVTVISTGEVRRLRARVASPEEKESLWPAIVTSYKGYAGYQKRTHRDIPVVICEATPDSARG
jgi:deazaflavin-dependent oxidoreductase (nitroreductase family)